MTDWIQAICSIIGTFLAFWGIVISLPKIGKQVKEISNKIIRRRFKFCENCPYENVCVSPFIEDAGNFDKKNEINNKEVAEWIIKLYEEIKNYKFSEDNKFYGSKEHQECLLRKLTMALNLIGSSNMAFNMIKNENNNKI